MELNEFKAALNDAYLDLVFEDALDPDYEYDIRIRPGYSTACWTFKDKHIVFVGDEVFEKAVEDKYYLASYLVHEVGHSLYTERDLKAVNVALKTEKIPFKMLNLAEDARIEVRMARLLERLFKWAEYERLDTPIAPVQILFYIIQHDGDVDVKDIEHGARVMEYYHRFIAQESTWELIPILKEWMEEFPSTEEDCKNMSDPDGGEGDPDGGDSYGSSSGSEPKRLEDLLESMELAENAEALAEALEESVSIDADSNEGTPSGEVGDYTEEALNTTAIAEHTNGKLSIAGGAPWRVELAHRYADELEPLFQEKSIKRASKRASKNINMDAFMPYNYSYKFFMQEKYMRNTSKKFAVILDTSGSMYSCMPDMQVVIGTLNELSLRGCIEGHVILSGVIGKKAIYETYEFPIDENIITSFQARYSAEGLSGALRNNMEILSQADHVFVLTDGDIVDEPIDKDQLHKLGVYTTGIYIGRPTYEASMSRWFDESVVALNLESCIDTIVCAIQSSSSAA